MTLLHERDEQARDGVNLYVICRVRSDWVVLGGQQFIRGNSLLLPDPVVGILIDLSEAAHSQFLLDMTLVGVE
jgi:hypothetical protein